MLLDIPDVGHFSPSTRGIHSALLMQDTEYTRLSRWHLGGWLGQLVINFERCDLSIPNAAVGVSTALVAWTS